MTPLMKLLRMRVCMIALLLLAAMPASAQPDLPDVPFESSPLLKITPDRNLGEVLAVAMNSKGP